MKRMKKDPSGNQIFTPSFQLFARATRTSSLSSSPTRVSGMISGGIRKEKTQYRCGARRAVYQFCVEPSPGLLGRQERIGFQFLENASQSIFTSKS